MSRFVTSPISSINFLTISYFFGVLSFIRSFIVCSTQLESVDCSCFQSKSGFPIPCGILDFTLMFCRYASSVCLRLSVVTHPSSLMMECLSFDITGVPYLKLSSTAIFHVTYLSMFATDTHEFLSRYP